MSKPDVTRKRANLLEVQIRCDELQWEWLLNDNVTTGSFCSGTPLHLATWLAAHETAYLLLARGALVNSVDDWGNTPLSLAAIQGDVQMTMLLLEHGACVESANYDYSPPLMFASAI